MKMCKGKVGKNDASILWLFEGRGRKNHYWWGKSLQDDEDETGGKQMKKKPSH